MKPRGRKPKREKQAAPLGRPIYYVYKLKEILKLRELLREALEFEFLDKIPEQKSFERFVSLVQEILPGHVRYDVLEDSLRHVAGVRSTIELLDSVAWRMAGNVERLKQQRVVPVWHIQRTPEWVPTQIISCKRQRSQGKKSDLGAMFGFRALAGTSASLTMYKWWSLRMARYYSREFGYTRARGATPARYPYTHPEQLVGLRVYVLVDPALCEDEPGFEQISFSPTLSKWNKDTISCRFRTMPGFICPLGRGLDAPCHRCPRGFLTCRAGTHRQDWVKRLCPKCEKKTWFDPESTSDFCVDCFIREVYGRKN